MAVGPDDAVPRPPDVESESFPDGMLLPGLVNAHTHLELTGFDLGPPDPDFVSWIGRVRAVKETRSPEAFLEAARAGVADCFAAGVTTIADTGDSGAVIQAMAEAGASGIAYQEVFGPHPSQADEALRGLQSRTEALARFAVGRVRLGVSPHAPYTRERTAVRVGRALGARGRSSSGGAPRGVGRGIGAARAGDGPVRRGVDVVGTSRCRSCPAALPWIGWMRTACSASGRSASTWCGSSAADLERLARRRCAVAHCPLSNAAHGHGAAPLSSFLRHGLRVGLGTDSVLSVGRLDLLAEARAAQALAGLDPAAALALCTVGGAAALGLEGEIGSLAPGKWGDCVAVRPRLAAGRAPVEAALATGPDDVIATFVGGRDVYRAKPVRP